VRERESGREGEKEWRERRREINGSLQPSVVTLFYF
jgi:hypothetical protein